MVTCNCLPPFARLLGNTGKVKHLNINRSNEQQNGRTPFTVPLKSKLPVSSRFSRDEILVSRDESLVSRDESLVSRDSLKQQFWNKLQANCLARSRLQSCAKVNENEFRFVLFEISPNFRSIFRSVRATVKRNFGDNSPRQAKNRIEKLLLRIFEVGKYRRKFTSNQMKCPPTFL